MPVNRDVNTLSGGGCYHPSVLVIRDGRGPCLMQASRGHQGKEGVGKSKTHLVRNDLKLLEGHKSWVMTSC
jgi:hypothetical protein